MALTRLSNQANGGLLVDTSGGLYGVTANDGTVFKLVRGASKADAIYNFQSGYVPSGALIADKRGDLFGTTGTGGVGTAYELMRSGNGYTERLLHRFPGNEGQEFGCAGTAEPSRLNGGALTLKPES